MPEPARAHHQADVLHRSGRRRGQEGAHTARADRGDLFIIICLVVVGFIMPFLRYAINFKFSLEKEWR